MQPKFITKDMVEEAIEIAISKGKQIEHKRLYFKKIEGGLGIQAFHHGDYNNMNNTLLKMQAFAKQNGYDQYTHDIYLNDATKTKTDNLKTIMRIMIYK